jgi:hypothetical protein
MRLAASDAPVAVKRRIVNRLTKLKKLCIIGLVNKEFYWANYMPYVKH